MQLLSAQLLGIPIFGFQTGTQVGLTTSLVINPDTLALAAFVCHSPSHPNRLLLPQDVRQSGPEGFIVDSDESLADPNDIVRLQPLLQMPFRLMGLPVVTQSGQRLGRVEEFTVDPADYSVQKFHVRRPLLSHLWRGSLIIDRSQVAEVNRQQLIVRDAALVVPTGQTLAEPGQLRS